MSDGERSATATKAKERNNVALYIVLVSDDDGWIAVSGPASQGLFEAKNKADARSQAAQGFDDAANQKFVAIRFSEWDPKSPQVEQPPPRITWK